jgi:putative endonuclease
VLRQRWSVYIVRCRDGALYTGIATDVARRIAQHAAPGGGRGAKSLRGRAPLALAVRRVIGSRSLAQSVERRIKALSRPRKLWLIEKRSRLDRLVAAARAERSGASINAAGRVKDTIQRLRKDQAKHSGPLPQ